MKKYVSFLLVMALAICMFTACGQTEPAETKPQLTYAGKSVAFIGDSITYGIGLENLTNQYWLHLENNMNLDLKLYAYVDAVKQLGAAHELPVIDLYTMMADEFTEANCENYMPDKLHPNEAGHELMARRIQAWLEENIETVLG